MHYAQAVLADLRGDADAASRAWAWVPRLDARNAWAHLAAARAARNAGDLATARVRLAAVDGEWPALWLERGLLTVAEGGDGTADLLRAGAEGYPEAFEAAWRATATVAVLDAWSAVELPPHRLDARVIAAQSLGRASCEDAQRAFDWVPSPSRAHRWSVGCGCAPVRAWMMHTGAAGWSEDWAAVCPSTDQGPSQ